MRHNHPGWAILRLIVVMVTLVTVLCLTASRFDDTELKTILAMFMAVAGAEGITSVLAKR